MRARGSHVLRRPFLFLVQISIWISISFQVTGETLPSSTSTALYSPQVPDVFQISASVSASPPDAAAGSGNHRAHLKKTIVPVAIVISSLITAIVMFALFCCLYRKWVSVIRVKNDRPRSVEDTEKGSDPEQEFDSKILFRKAPCVSIIDYNKLETATNGFEASKILGRGGFGCVYEAQISENFRVAVKKLDDCGEAVEREFQNEVDLLKRIHHPNIISLLGYSVNGDAKLLVYELMSNGSLEAQLHGPSQGSALSWNVRMKIALDIAKGLEYLHENCDPKVIHRDLKSSNILLDSNFGAKLSDFGLAVINGTQNSELMSMSGTLGYLAPEYLSDGKLTEKSDVYAFGVVLLELMLGRKPVERLSSSQCRSIITWALPQLKDRSKLPNIVDPAIKEGIVLKHLYQVAAVAVLCVQMEPSYRPLMTDVLHSLVPLVPVELGGTLKQRQQQTATAGPPT